jgi:hypothetical protein
VRRLWWLVLVACGACGRVGFDPLGNDAPNSDGGTDGNSGGSGGGSGEACATARRVAIGVPLAVDIASATNDIPGRPCGDGPELVLAFEESAPVTRIIRFDAAFNGAFSLSTTCPLTAQAGCQTFASNSPVMLMSSVGAGTSYIVIDWLGGTGTTGTLRVE